MGRQTIIQPGTSTPRDLLLFVNVAADYIREQARASARDAVVAELWGERAKEYAPLLGAYGGFTGWVRQVEEKLSTVVRRTCLTTWGAGSLVAIEACAGAVLPDAIVMIDGLCGSKPDGSKPGDGQVAMGLWLEAVASYALGAALGDKVMVIMHSPSTVSSGECAAAVRRHVEARSGLPFVEVDEQGPRVADTVWRLGGEHNDGLRNAVRVGNLTIVEFGGERGAGHVREARLFEEVWGRFVPFATDPDEPPCEASRPVASAEAP